jgi:hypothetical protein
MAHPLDGAFKRVNRADVHIRELRELIERFRQQNEDKIAAQKRFDAKQLALKPGQKLTGVERNPLPDLPEDVPIIVGEVIYNLRAALDYLIYELAIKDSGSPKSGTQFPVEDVKSDPKNPRRGFDARARECLTGVNPVHVEAIEALQPYAGNRWLKILREISNPDKHRQLTVVAGQGEEIANWETDVSGSFDNRPGTIMRGVGAIYTDDYFQLDYTVKVEFPDGTPVIEVLEIVKSTVAGILESFKSEF